MKREFDEILFKLSQQLITMAISPTLNNLPPCKYRSFFIHCIEKSEQFEQSFFFCSLTMRMQLIKKFYLTMSLKRQQKLWAFIEMHTVLEGIVVTKIMKWKGLFWLVASVFFLSLRLMLWLNPTLCQQFLRGDYFSLNFFFIYMRRGWQSSLFIPEKNCLIVVWSPTIGVIYLLADVFLVGTDPGSGSGFE